MNEHTCTGPVSDNHPTVDLPAYLEGPRLPTTYTPVPEWATTEGGDEA